MNKLNKGILAAAITLPLVFGVTAANAKKAAVDTVDLTNAKVVSASISGKGKIVKVKIVVVAGDNSQHQLEGNLKHADLDSSTDRPMH